MHIIINKEEQELHAALLITERRREELAAFVVMGLFMHEHTAAAMAYVATGCTGAHELSYAIHFMIKEEKAIRSVPTNYKEACTSMLLDIHDAWTILHPDNADQLEERYRDLMGLDPNGTPIDRLISAMLRSTGKALLEGPSKNCQCQKCLAKRAEAKDASEAGAAKAAAANRARYN